MWLVGVVSRRRVWLVSEWNLRVWVVGVAVRRNIDILILLIPSPPASFFFAAASLSFVR